MKKIIYGLIVLVVLLSGILFLIPGDNSVSIGYKKHLAYLPVFVAVDNGYFQNLDVEMIVFDSTNQMISALVSNNIDAVVGGANLQTVYSLEEKSPGSVRIFSTVDTGDSLFSCVLIKKGSRITMDEIKKVATLPGTFAPLWVRETLHGVEIEGIAPELQLAALESGSIDALFTVEPVCSFGINRGIAEIIYENPMNNLAPYFAASVFSKRFSKEKPTLAKKIVKANDMAIDFIRQNPEESLDIMVKYTGYKKELIRGMEIPNFRKSSETDLHELQSLENRLYIAGNLKKQIPVRDLF